MKNKKGFTLIELLAVIVILAVIMVIAVPQILNVIESSKNSAADSSIKLVKDAIKTQVTTAGMAGVTFEKTGECYLFDFENNNENAQNLSLKNKERIGGSIKYCNGKFEDDTLTFDGTSNNEPSTDKVIELTDTNSNEVADIGEIITIGTERFYVISNDNINVKALAEYNLYVGNIYDSLLSKLETIETNVEGYGLQNENARGYVKNQGSVGTIAFSSSIYWSSAGIVDLNNSENLIYPHLISYKTKLESTGAVICDVTLITKEELDSLGCDESSNSCNSAPSFVYQTKYWSRSVLDATHGIFYISSDDNGGYGLTTHTHEDTIGIRPVIEVSKSDISY